ncbi:MAG: heme-binding protein [Oceanicoccus sp.]
MWKNILIALVISVFSGHIMAIEEPEYEVLETSGTSEIRAYKAMIVAETLVDGSMDEASSKGFRRIAGYIFGANTSTVGENTKIDMTAPVTIKPKAEKISMTAPVTMKGEEGSWRVHFVMPGEYTMETLPRPNETNVILREVPAQKYAVIRFSGLAGEKKIAVKTEELMEWLAEKNISQQGQPQLARYNPPWTLPFFRRNEVMIAIGLAGELKP